MPKFKPNTSSFRMLGKSPTTQALYKKSPKKELTKEEIDKRIVAETAKLKTATQESATGKKSTTTKKKVDWKKAPKMNTQARRDWYTKNKLAQDKTTKLESTTPDPKTFPQGRRVSEETKKAKSKAEPTKKDAMSGKKTLGETKLGKIKVGKDGKRLADTKVGKAFSEGRAKAAENRAKRKAIFDAKKAEREAKRAKKNKK